MVKSNMNQRASPTIWTRVRISFDIDSMTSKNVPNRYHETAIVIPCKMSYISLVLRSNNDSASKVRKMLKHTVFTTAFAISPFAHKSNGNSHPDLKLYTN